MSTRDPDPRFDYAAAARELPPASGDDLEEPPIPLELVLQPASRLPQIGPWFWSLLAILLMGVGLIQLVQHLNASRGQRPEQLAMAALLDLGAAQSAYASRNLDREYGSPTDLRRLGVVPAGFRPGAVIPGYSVAFWSLGTPIWVNSGISPASVAPGEPYRTRRILAPATFTLVAVPYAPSSKLRTFALCEDGVLRMPDGQVANFEGACEWPAVPASDLPKSATAE